MNEPTQTVSFRLASATVKQLADRAAGEHLSLGEAARRIVLDALSDTAGQQTREDLAELRVTLERIREDIATATAALLVNAGKSNDAAAQEWVRRSLFSNEG